MLCCSETTDKSSKTSRCLIFAVSLVKDNTQVHQYIRILPCIIFLQVVMYHKGYVPCVHGLMKMLVLCTFAYGFLVLTVNHVNVLSVYIM